MAVLTQVMNPKWQSVELKDFKNEIESWEENIMKY